MVFCFLSTLAGGLPACMSAAQLAPKSQLTTNGEEEGD